MGEELRGGIGSAFYWIVNIKRGGCRGGRVGLWRLGGQAKKAQGRRPLCAVSLRMRIGCHRDRRRLGVKSQRQHAHSLIQSKKTDAVRGRCVIRGHDPAYRRAKGAFCAVTRCRSPWGTISRKESRVDNAAHCQTVPWNSVKSFSVFNPPRLWGRVAARGAFVPSFHNAICFGCLETHPREPSRSSVAS